MYAANPRRKGGQISRSTDRLTRRTGESYQLSAISAARPGHRYVKSARGPTDATAERSGLCITGADIMQSRQDDSDLGEGMAFQEWPDSPHHPD